MNTDTIDDIGFAEKKHLAGLDAAARLTPAFRLGTETADLAAYLRPMPGQRHHLLEPVRLVLDEAMNRFEQSDAADSDSWVGPRLHAALRLSRREAGSRDVWRFLGVWAADYVRWRFGPDPSDDDPGHAAAVDRFTGPHTKQALARLWWMTELFRNGSDYRPAALALTNQDLANNLFRMDIAHHRPTCQATVAALADKADKTKLLTGRRANALAKAANVAAATLSFEAMAPDEPLDSTARRAWEAERADHDPRNFFETLPEGPDDPVVPDGSVATMTKVLADLLAGASVRGAVAAT